MAYQQFTVSNVNPNDNMGGGGCLCDPAKQIDCKPPYIVVYGNEMDSAVSPYPVICASCVCRMKQLLEGEVHSVGERNIVQGSNAPAVSAQVESPEFDDSELLRALAARPEDTPDI